MTEIKTVTVGEIGENAYILDYGEGVLLIDPGADYVRIKALAAEKPVTHVLLTHAHYDHIGAVAAFQREGAKVCLHKDDVELLQGAGNLAALFGACLNYFKPDVILQGGETLDIGGNKLEVLHTPGHTAGSVCYVFGDTIFSGDTLFYLSVGRTDFPSGNQAALHRSVKEILFALSGEYKVLPGHGCPTQLSFERKNNPYV